MVTLGCIYYLFKLFFTTNITRLISVKLFVRWVYDKYDNTVKPVYEDLPGWQESTVGVNNVEGLPAAARAYIARIEEAVSAPIDIISTGPDRVETIVLQDPFTA
jgi:adenylosuccinate synthase